MEVLMRPLSSFADLKGFSLGMVNLIASYSGEKVGFVGDIVVGPRGQAAVFGTAFRTGESSIKHLLTINFRIRLL